MAQIVTIILTIFYVLWLCFVAFVLYRLTTAAQKIATAIYRMAEQRTRADDDHPA